VAHGAAGAGERVNASTCERVARGESCASQDVRGLVSCGVMLRGVVAALLLVGCTCDAPRAAPPPSALPSFVALPEPTLPSATRDDLPAATPLVTVTITRTTYAVSNAALVGTWPSTERAVLPQPIVDRTIDDATTVLEVPALVSAFSDAVTIDRARAAAVGAEGVMTAFAIRAAPGVAYARVLAAIYAAGQAGLREPRLVLLRGTSERVLPIALPRAEGPDREAVEAVNAALAALGEPIPEVDAGLAPRVPRTYVSLDDSRVRVRPAGTDVASESALDETTAREASTGRSALDVALDAAGEHPIVFEAPPTARYGEVVPLLEILARPGDLSLAVSVPVVSPTSGGS